MLGGELGHLPAGQIVVYTVKKGGISVYFRGERAEEV